MWGSKGTLNNVYSSQKQLPRNMKPRLVIIECAGYISGSYFCGDYSLLVYKQGIGEMYGCVTE